MYFVVYASLLFDASDLVHTLHAPDERRDIRITWILYAVDVSAHHIANLLRQLGNVMHHIGDMPDHIDMLTGPIGNLVRHIASLVRPIGMWTGQIAMLTGRDGNRGGEIGIGACRRSCVRGVVEGVLRCLGTLTW